MPDTPLATAPDAPDLAPTVSPARVAPSFGGAVVSLDDVTVDYGKNQALAGVSVPVSGRRRRLLGPNGAGKSTMIKALLGFIVPDAGGDARARARRGAQAAGDSRAHRLHARERRPHPRHECRDLRGATAASWRACRAVDAMQRAHEVLYYVGLGEARYRNVETYSTGMKQRIKLAQALVHDPDLLFLDEPTNGMDPKGRDEMLELIRDLGHNKGVNLILSSHLLPDVEFTCDHVIVMDKGRIAAQGPIAAVEGPGAAACSRCASRAT